MPEFLAALSDEAAARRPASTPAIAIDIGASPGGWTDLLSRHVHSRVIALDPGDLAFTRSNVVHMRELLLKDDDALMDRLRAAIKRPGGAPGGSSSRMLRGCATAPCLSHAVQQALARGVGG